MSIEHASPPLPTVLRLDRRAQLRWLLIGGGVFLLIWLAMTVIRALTAPTPAADHPLPPGTFHATPDQLAQMKLLTVGDAGAGAPLDATGTIAVDGEHSAPVTLPFSGRVVQVLVEAGQDVRRGQPLLRLASNDYADARNALTTARTQAESAQAQLRIAEDNAKRQQAIYATAGGALKDYRQAASDLVVARAAVAAAQGAVRTAQDRLALFGRAAGTGGQGAAIVTYTAPVAGTVVARDVAPGEFVGAGGDKPLLTIADLSRVWLVAQLPERDAAGVHVGDAVTVTTPAYPGRRFAAVIDNVAVALDPVTHRLAVRATVRNPDGALKPEMFASFAIRLAAPTGPAGVRVPSDAVIHEGDGARVWVAGANGLLTARTVTVADSDDGWDRVTAGLKPGERIVTAGALFVNEAGLNGGGAGA